MRRSRGVGSGNAGAGREIAEPVSRLLRIMMSQLVGMEAVKVGPLLTVDVMVLFACCQIVVLGYQVTGGM